MVLAGVRTGDDEHIVLDHLRRRIAHGRGADRLLQCDHAPCMAQARAMVHIVRAELGAEDLLQEVVVFVGGFRAAIH